MAYRTRQPGRVVEASKVFPRNAERFILSHPSNIKPSCQTRLRIAIIKLGGFFISENIMVSPSVFDPNEPNGSNPGSERARNPRNNIQSS